MLVYHGTTPQQAREFIKHGIDCHILHRRAIHGPQDNIPGLFVTPIRWVARRFGLCILEIEVDANDLKAPPLMAQQGISIEDALANPLEPQAFITKRVESRCIKIVECQEKGHAKNPYEPDESSK